MTTLVVGRGLLGRAVLNRLAEDGESVAVVDVPWGDPDAAAAAIASAAARLPSPWHLMWCAGAGVIASTEADLQREVATLSKTLDLIEHPPNAAYLASSAGAAYSGSPDAPPYTESSVAAPVGAYAEAKLATEEVFTKLAARGTRVVIARISNLYGPGQNLEKPQGLISHMVRNAIERRPLQVYVALDTLRDYLYVADAAAMSVAALNRVAAKPAATCVVKVLASGRASSVAMLLATFAKLNRRRVPVQSARTATFQKSDLRLRSQVWTDIDLLATTPLPVGIATTMRELSAQHTQAARAVRG